jgi:hypothetical protein
MCEALGLILRAAGGLKKKRKKKEKKHIFALHSDPSLRH